MSNEGYHENVNMLSSATKDMHRAITSLMEELQAFDWYNQRIDVLDDEALKKILVHNRDEEKEHAAMLLEWIRQHDQEMEYQLKKYLFSETPIIKQNKH